MRGFFAVAIWIWLAVSVGSAWAQPQCPLTPSPDTSNSLCASTAFVAKGTVTSIGGVRGAITLGGGLSIVGQTLSSSAGASAALPPQARLTLTSATPVTTTDVVGATAHFCTPYLGYTVPITTDGVNFASMPFSELTQATTDATKSPAAVGNNSVYFVILWSDNGTLRCTRSPAWTSDTNPGAGAGTAEVDFTTKFPTNKWAITNGPGANLGLVLGAERSNGSAQLIDSQAFRWVSNIYIPVPRPMVVSDPTPSYTYTTNTFRQCDGTADNELDFLSAFSGSLIEAWAVSSFSNSNTLVKAVTGIGLDQATTNNATITTTAASAIANGINPIVAAYHGYPGLGRHFLACIEKSAATGTTTWFTNSQDAVGPLSGWVNN